MAGWTRRGKLASTSRAAQAAHQGELEQAQKDRDRAAKALGRVDRLTDTIKNTADAFGDAIQRAMEGHAR